MCVVWICRCLRLHLSSPASWYLENKVTNEHRSVSALLPLCLDFRVINMADHYGDSNIYNRVNAENVDLEKQEIYDSLHRYECIKLALTTACTSHEQQQSK
jgi:hypothetical protein